MGWIKKWYYLILFVGTGVVYLVCVNGRQVYAGVEAIARGGYDVPAAGQKNTGAGDDCKESGVRNPQPDPGAGGNDIWQTGDEMADEDGALRGDETADEGGALRGDGTTDEDGPAGDGETESRQDEPAGTGVSYMTVEDEYFADAVFIGDSRTVGMGEYGGLKDIATFYASTGLSVHKLFTAQIVPVQGQKKKITIEQALQENTFSKIYFMIGINEMGTGTVDTFMAKYEQAVTRLQELQPDAIIYLQGIMKVTAKRSEQGDYITNEGIEERNGRIAQLADNEKIFYLDVNPVLCDDTGGMEDSYTHDGVHLKAMYIEIWKQFLKEHAVVR